MRNLIHESFKNFVHEIRKWENFLNSPKLEEIKRLKKYTRHYAISNVLPKGLVGGEVG